MIIHLLQYEIKFSVQAVEDMIIKQIPMALDIVVSQYSVFVY